MFDVILVHSFRGSSAISSSSNSMSGISPRTAFGSFRSPRTWATIR
jgi:hypothetical protein